MYKCAVQLIINDRKSILGKFEKWSEANKFKLFRQENDFREEAEYKIVEL